MRIWDSRARAGGSKLSVQAHANDANVISWSALVSYLLASGADDGAFKIWDLRAFKAAQPVANFSWHRGPVTSVEWAPDVSADGAREKRGSHCARARAATHTR